MIKVKFIKAEITMFDDVEYSYKVSDKMHTYIVTIAFCGAIENNEIDLYTSMCADISVQETKRSKEIIDSNILKNVFDRLDMDYEYQSYEKDKNNMEYFAFKNESSFYSSMSDLYRVLQTLVGELIESQFAIDPTPTIKEVI